MPKQFLRRAQVAARYGINPRTVDRWKQDGRIPQPIHKGKFPLWDEALLEEFERRAITAPQSATA